MKLLIKLFRFYMSSICPECGEKTYDSDEGTCTNCGLGFDESS